jgi:hypothetical protein
MLYQLRKAVDVCSTLWFACSYAPHTPHTYTPRSTHLSPEHTTLEFTLQFSDVYAPDPTFAPAPRTVHTTLHSHHVTH